MENKINVTMHIPGLVEAILALSDEMAKLNTILSKDGELKDYKKKEASVEVPIIEVDSTERRKEEFKPIAIEEVREILAAKSRSGKQAEVKAIIERFGASKLTDIHPCNYRELLEFAEEI